jgi:hypothetical protein
MTTLLLMVVLQLLSVPSFSPVLTPEDIAAIRATPIGQQIKLVESQGCNTCYKIYVRVSETEIQGIDGTLSCTLMNCPTPQPIIQFDREHDLLPHTVPADGEKR